MTVSAARLSSMSALALAGDAVDHRAVGREGVAPAGLREATDERVVLGVEEDHLHLVALAPRLLDQLGRLGEEVGVAGVDHHRQVVDVGPGVGGQLGDLGEQHRGQVVDAEEAGILQRPEGGGLPCARHPGDDHHPDRSYGPHRARRRAGCCRAHSISSAMGCGP